jgi:glycosyltransferase involved in cell wall biosynthesis
VRAELHRVLFLNSSAELFGSERALIDLAVAFERRGHTTKTVVPASGSACELFAARGLDVVVEPSLPIVRRSSGVGGQLRIGFGSLHPEPSLQSLVGGYRPTVVYSNTSHVLAGPALARRHGAVHVWHVREIERVPSQVRRAWGALLLRTGRVVTISRAVASSLFRPTAIRKHLDRTLHVVHDGIDLSGLPYREPRSVSCESRQVLVPGRLTPWKGQHFAVEAMHHTRGGLALRVVGTATTARDHDWVERALVPMMARSANVSLAPPTTEVGRMYRGADFLLQASLAPEPFGRTVLEGMACGLVPIVPDVGGPVEVVRHEIDGFVYRVGDVKSLAAALDAAASASVDELRTLSRSARARVESCFTADQNADQILERALAPTEGRRRMRLRPAGGTT